MPRGEFQLHKACGDVLRIPNQFTVIGMQQIVRAAFWKTDYTWHIGLCAHNPADDIALYSVDEPTIGVNGYQRQELHLDSGNWPTIGVVNGETYVESAPFTFIATGAYDKMTNRMFITDGEQVIAISSALPGGLAAVSANLTSAYRLYFR